jgi:hypothetical protein
MISRIILADLTLTIIKNVTKRKLFNEIYRKTSLVQDDFSPRKFEDEM